MTTTTGLNIGLMGLGLIGAAAVFLICAIKETFSKILEQEKIKNGYLKNIEKALLDLNDWIAHGFEIWKDR